MDELERIRREYDRRDGNAGIMYDPLDPAVFMPAQERERALIRFLRKACLGSLRQLRLLEIGCGTGGNLLELLRLGFRPENLHGVELVPERAAEARHRLPDALQIVTGNAAEVGYPDNFFDIVFQSMVFTSIQDVDLSHELAKTMWRVTRPGGGVLWYDFTYDNPRNPAVHGVRVRDIKKLFPQGKMMVRRVTLAPPLSRLVSRIHPALYTVLNTVPLLRTHVLCWIRKGGKDRG